MDMLKITTKDKAMLASYARSLVGALMAVYSTGSTDPTDYAKGAIAAIIPPIMRWVNKNDQAFGRGNSQS
jgi:energy-converting hydrogenase Eha subunit F